MLKDIKSITELYLHATGKLPENKSWSDFHEEVMRNAPKDAIGLLADANPPAKCKYALIVNVDTKNNVCDVKYKNRNGEVFNNYVEVGKVDDWSYHLFWQGSGGARSDKIRNTPHQIYSQKGDFSKDDFIAPLQTILNDYCRMQEGKGKKIKYLEVGPIFWDESKKAETEWLKNIINILEDNKTNLDVQVKEKFPPLKQGESVFVGLAIDGQPIGEYELFRRYLIFVRTRAGIKNGSAKFKNKNALKVMREIVGICPSCLKEKPRLDQWQSTAELSFYQTTGENHLSYAFPISAFKLCEGCANLLFVFKQHLLEILTHKLAGNECLILPSIKLIPPDQNEKRRLYENLKSLWSLSKSNIQSAEERLLYRLAQLPSYATVTFIFGYYITVGKSQNVRRLDEINIVFPDVLPSRLSQIAGAMQEVNKRLIDMWSLTDRSWACTWNIQDDFYLLHRLFYPAWEEKKKDKSRRRGEVERYLRAIFYGQKVTYDEIAEDCFNNLVSAIKTTRHAKEGDDNAKYARDNYIGELLSLFVLLDEMKIICKSRKEVNTMSDLEDLSYTFITMPELSEFVEKHPLFKDKQYLAPFFVGCLFSYAENLQRDNSRLAAYNWLGTMTLTYEDITQDIYPKVLNYIKNKEKIVSSHRLQELMKAVSHYDVKKCDNDRVALVAFCHGWAVGRDFIYKKKDEPKQ